MGSAHLQLTIKGGKVRKSHMEKLSLDPPPGTAEEVIQEAFSELTAPQSPLQQVSAVEKLLSAASGSEKSARICTAILMSALLQLKPKVQLRNKILKFLPSISNKYPQLYQETVMTVLSCALNSNDPIVLVQGVSLLVEDGGTLLLFWKPKKKHDENGSNFEESSKQMMANNTLVELHPMIVKAMLQGVNLLWQRSFKEASSSVEASVILQWIQQLIKNSTMYLQQHCSNPVQNINMSQETHDLLQAVLSVVRHRSCPLDLRINCGQLLVLIHKIITQGKLIQLVQHVVNGDGQYCDLTSLAQLAIINGVLCNAQGKDLFVSCDNTSLGEQVLQAVLTFSGQANDGNIAVGTVRVINQWTLRTIEALESSYEENVLKHVLDFSSHLMSELLDYLWVAWDHFLDSVKHATKESFMNLIKIQQSVELENSKYHLLNMCRTFLNQLSTAKYRYSAVSCMVPVVGTQTLLELYPDLPHELLSRMKDPAMASHAAELLEALFTQHQKEIPSGDWQNMWLTIFIDLFSKEMQTFGYELLFKKLLFTCPESLDTAVARLIQCSEEFVSEKLCLLIMCVKIGRYSPHWLKSCQDRCDQNNPSIWKCILPYKIIKICLSHLDESVRTAAFSLLCESPKSTELLEEPEHDLILDYYVYSMTSQTPSYKQHLLRSTKKLLHRIKDGSAALIRLERKKDNYSAVRPIIDKQTSFCTKLFSLMVQNLSCGANTLRRSTALHILQLFHEILLEDSGVVLSIDQLIQDQTYIDTLLCVLDDSYETHKIIALKLLFSVVQENWGMEHEAKIYSITEAAFSQASSCRPPDSLTAAYLLKFLSNHPVIVKMVREKLVQENHFENSREVLCRYIIDSLRKEVKLAQENLLMAAASGPMYGFLQCLKVLLLDIPESELNEFHQLWFHVIQEVLSVCYTVSELVAPVVRNSSPEGHLPMDLNPESLATLRAALRSSLGNQHFQDREIILSQESKPDELVKAQAVSAQMLLLCAWRCVKEVSLILGDLVQHMPLSPSAFALLTVHDVITIGQYFLTQLLETKHRGAFEQSYIGFGRVCERLWQCEEEQLRKLPEEWLTDVFRSIQNDDDTRLCATRRSAGVPFIVQAVLSSEPSIRRAVCFKSTMKNLLTLAKECQYDGTGSRIHAFNILRAVYRDTRLGDLVIPYVSSGVKAAIRGYRSTSWAERNSAALLFAALMTRMLGVKQTQDDLSHKNAMSALVFFRRYPELFDFLKSELEAGAANVKERRLVPALFPTLLLLARLSPAPLEGRTTSVSLTSFTPAVLQCASSSVLHLRALASHAIVPLVPPSELHQVVHQLCRGAYLTDQNRLHGSLLCLLKLLKQYCCSIPSADMNSVIEKVFTISWAATEDNPCLLTRCCALELFTFLNTKHLIPKTSPILTYIISASSLLIQSNDSSLPSKPWSALCQRQAAQFLLKCYHSEESDALNSVITLINSGCYEVRLCVLEHIACLQNPQEIIIKQLLERVKNQEMHTECLTQIYCILSKIIHPQQVQNNVIERDHLTFLLQHIISRTTEEASIELMTAMLQFSIVVVTTLLSLKPVYNFSDAVTQWLEIILSYSASEYSTDIHLMVAEGISNIVPFFPSHPSISEAAKLEVFESVVTLLQNDSELVRDRVAKGVKSLWANHTDQPQLFLQSTRVLPKICDIIGNTGTPEGLSLLVKLALKEDLPQDFGLAQDDDRVFDKGEMNVYCESLTVARTASKSLSNALSSWPSDTIPPVFLKHHIKPFMCSPSPMHNKDGFMETAAGSQNDIFLSISSLLYILEQDIHFVFQHISSMTDTAVYCVRNLNVWLVRLGCRSAIWRALTHHYHIQSALVSAVVVSLQGSVIKGKFLSEILDDLL